MATLSPQAKRMQQARTTLLLDQPFFGVLALHLDLIEDSKVSTACTNGKYIKYNPAFVDTCTPDQLVGLLAHEVMHPASGHCWRRDARNPKKYNIAADYAINPLICEAGLALPEGALLDPQYAGKSSEWIYDRLPDSPDNSGGDGAGTGWGDFEDSDSDGGDGAAGEAEWQQRTQQAAQAAQAQGKLPGSLKRLIDTLTAPSVDWRSLLRKYMQQITRADYTWTRPNRRYTPRGLYLPTLRSETCGPIVVAIDTSGSVDDVLLAQFGAEVRAIAAEMLPESVTVVYCDSAVNHVDTFGRGEPVEVSPHGGGGTAFAPVFEHVDASGETPACLVYLTDLQGSFPETAPDYPVIWCSTIADRAPFGDVVPCGR